MSKFLPAALALLVLCTPAWAGDSLQIAAASDLATCLDELDAAFLKTRPGVDIKATTGSSGNFVAQIKNGAPFDLFLSADLSYPRALAKDGLADPATLTLYATGHLVLWSLNPAVDVSQGLAVLDTAAVKKFAIANPDVAPYGRAAKAALQKAGLWERVAAKAVSGENIAQTAAFVQTGNVDAGIVALSFVKSPKAAGQGHYFAIPEDQYPTLEQGGVVLAKGKDNAAAAAYIGFLRSPAARSVFDKYGFLLPAKPAP